MNGQQAHLFLDARPWVIAAFAIGVALLIARRIMSSRSTNGY